MKRYFLRLSFAISIIMLVASCTSTLPWSTQNTWQSVIGGTGDDQVSSVVQVSDGGYITVGYTTSTGEGLRDIYVLRLNATGDLIWEKEYGGTGNDEGKCIQKTSDGGYIIAGYTDSLGNGGEDVYILKLDQNGSVLWQKTYGGIGNDRANCIQQTSDGYVITGYTSVVEPTSIPSTANSDNLYASANRDVYVLKVDKNGTLVWEKRFGGTGIDEGKWIQQTNDGGYIIAGYTNSFGAGGNDIYIIKLDSNGDYDWDKTYGGVNDDIANGIVQSSDGNYVFAGSTGSTGSILSSQLYVVKISSIGQHDVLWQKTYGENYMNSAYSIQKTKDGGYVLAGVKDFQVTSIMPFEATGDLYVLKIDSNGNLVWQKTYGGDNLDSGSSIRQTSDGGYVVGGTTQSFVSETNDAYILKLDSSGNLGTY